MNEITQITALQLVFCIEKSRCRLISFIYLKIERNLDFATFMRLNVYSFASLSGLNIWLLLIIFSMALFQFEQFLICSEERFALRIIKFQFIRKNNRKHVNRLLTNQIKDKK